MSIFSNRFDAAQEEAAGYIAAVTGLLGDRDPFTVLEAQPAALEQITSGLTPEQVARPETPGKWSMLEVIQHLADSEMVWAYRLRRVLAEDRPRLSGYDQDLWAERLRYREVELDDALEQIRALRRTNLWLLRSLEPGALERIGVHSERGDESVAHMLRLYAGHDLVHLRQLERIRAGLG